MLSDILVKGYTWKNISPFGAQKEAWYCGLDHMLPGGTHKAKHGKSSLPVAWVVSEEFNSTLISEIKIFQISVVSVPLIKHSPTILYYIILHQFTFCSNSL